MSPEERAVMVAIADGVSALCYKQGWMMEYNDIQKALRHLEKEKPNG